VIGFWVLATVLAGLAVAALLIPAVRPRGGGDDRGRHVAVYRERHAELEREHARGHLSDADLAEAREELERELLANTTDTTDAGGTGGRAGPRRSAVAATLVVPLIGLGLYLATGAPRLIDQPASAGLTPAEIERFRQLPPEQRIRQLTPLVENRPRATRAWTLLAQAYRSVGRYGDAADAYARVRAQGQADPWLLARQAEALLLANDRQFSDRVENLIQRALDRDASNPLALMLAGHAALTRGDNAQAAQHWQRLASSLPADSDNRARVERLVARARGEAPADTGERASATAEAGSASADAGTGATSGDSESPRLTVRVQLDQAMTGSVAGDTPVFIFARPAGSDSGAPLAVRRTTVGALPTELTLTDANAMTPSRRLSQAQRVRVTARAALSGDVMAKSGDLQGQSQPVAVTRTQPLNIRIDQRID